MLHRRQRGLYKEQPQGEKGEDVVLAHFWYNDMVIDISARGRPYGFRHYSSGSRHIADQNVHPEPEIIEPLLLLARTLGDGYELIYNRIGNTAKTFHYQALQRGSLKIFKTLSVLWPAFVVEYRGSDPAALAKEISEEMKKFVSEGIDSDVAVRSEEDRSYRALVIPRHKGMKRPGGVFADESRFGLFGAAEMCGQLLCVRPDDAFEQMTGSAGGRLYEEALRELSYRPLESKSLRRAG